MKTESTAVFLSARNKATRLAEKELIEIHGKTVIEHLIDRLRRAKAPERIVLCTSTHPDDQVLVNIARNQRIDFFCGSEDDKLARYRDAALNFGVEFIAVVDGDDIFCEPAVIDQTMHELLKGDADYVIVQDLPLGGACFGVTRSALEKVCEVKLEQDTEVWGGYFTETGIFRSRLLQPADPALRKPGLRLTLDYQEDLDFFLKVFERLDPDGNTFFGLKEIIALVEREPELAAVNAQAQSKYLEHLKIKPKVAIRRGEL